MSSVPRWRVSPTLPGLKLIGAALLVTAGLVLGSDNLAVAAAALAGAVLATWGVRDLIVPERVAADTSGVTVVVGYAGRRRIPWAAVERVTVDRRSRRGLRSQLLEIDTGDAVHVFSRLDLGAEPEEVAATLNALRSGRS